MYLFYILQTFCATELFFLFKDSGSISTLYMLLLCYSLMLQIKVIGVTACSCLVVTER